MTQKELLEFLKYQKSFRNRYALKEYLEKNLQKDIDIGYLDSLREFIKNSIKDEIIYL